MAWGRAGDARHLAERGVAELLMVRTGYCLIASRELA